MAIIISYFTSGMGVAIAAAPEARKLAIIAAVREVMLMTCGLLAAGMPLLPPVQFLSIIWGTF
jgi:hypothetical protein